MDPSTISRELVRNTGARGYRFKQAHEKATHRRKKASDKPRKMTPELVEPIEEKLTREQWSPRSDQRPSGEGWRRHFSHERIYQMSWKNKKDGGALHLHLRHSGKKYNKRKGKNSGRGSIPNRVDIDQRPSIVAAKSRIGDWRPTQLSVPITETLSCRMSNENPNTPSSPSCGQSANSVVRACTRVLLRSPTASKTITYDNGKEFASHVEISNLAGVAILFCQTLSLVGTRPQRTHQRPIQTVLPKGLRSLYCSDTDVQEVEDKLNSRPRKILGNRTPREVFFNARTLPVALRSAPDVTGSVRPPAKHKRRGSHGIERADSARGN